MPVIEVHNLSKEFKDVLAVDQLSFSVNEGDVYGFLGQNGAGKSTTIRMLLTLIKPTSGDIHIFSRNIQKERYKILQQTGAIIEKPDLYKYLSAFDNLSIFARLSGLTISRKDIVAKLEAVGLSARSDSKVKTFSQGMKQRLGIAVALVHDPKLVILDEPANGLDPQGIADIRGLLLKLREHGKTVVISSHLLSEIEQVATRMIIIHKGKKIIEGSVSELLDPSETLVRIQTTDISFARQKIIASEFADLLQNDVDEICLKMNKNDVPTLARKFSDWGVGILSIQPRHSLEDYFISLTNVNHDEPVKY